MYTKFHQERADMSDRAHHCAQREIYPRFFRVPFEKLLFETVTIENKPYRNARNTVLDGELGIDRIVSVPVSNTDCQMLYRLPLRFAFQERFRAIQNASRRDITITDWNSSSNTPSEMYKIVCGYFMYGYWDDFNEQFGEIIVINVPSLLRKLCQPDYKVSDDRVPDNGKGQSFFTFSFEELNRIGVVSWHYDFTGKNVLSKIYHKPEIIQTSF